MKQAKEVAEEMVVAGSASEAEYFLWFVKVRVEGSECGFHLVSADNLSDTAKEAEANTVEWLTRLIERERAAAYEAGKADGAAEERERGGSYPGNFL